MSDVAGVTDAVTDFFGQPVVDNENLLAELGRDLADKRDAAILARKESGIEDVWTTCEESYLAIDDANRHEFAGAKWAKPTSMSGGVTANYDPGAKKKSSAFVRLTSRYVDMGASKISDILLPIDDKPFKLDPTPVPELVAQKTDLTPLLHPLTRSVLMRPANAEEMAKMGPPPEAAPGQPPPKPPMVPLTAADVAKMKLEKASKAAEKAETRIYDWLTESNFAGEMRKVIHDAARIGVGVLKAPTPVMSKSMAITKNGGAIALQIKTKVTPAAKWVSAWNIFPHEACGEDVNDGDHIFERDFISSQKLGKLKKDPTYLVDQIDKVLKEGPGKCYTEGQNPNEKRNKNRFEMFHFTGIIKRSSMMLTKAIGVDELPEEVDEVFAIATLINDTVIRAVINPMQSGSFNYHTMPWSRRAGHWAGVGVGEQVSMPQRMVNAGTRALLNNGGLSAGLQFVMDPLGVIPADGDPTITPNKLWYKSPDATYDDMRKAFLAIEFPNVGQQMMAIIDYAFKLAEEASNIPVIAQGQESKIEQTFGEAEQRNTNAHSLLRNLALSFDDHITKPVIDGFYEWLLLDPTVPDDEKGDFKPNAKGSLALVEKAIQEMTMPAIMQASLQPAYRIDPKRAAEQFLRSKRLDPRNLQYSEEEQKKMDEAPPPPPMPLMIEQVKGKNAMLLQQARTQGELQLVAAQAQQEQQALMNGGTTPHMASAQAAIAREQIRSNTAQVVEASRAHAEAARADKEMLIAQQNGEYNLRELELKRELAILEYTSKHNLTIEQTKVMLAQTAMQERTKRELASAEIQLAQSEGDKDRLHAQGQNADDRAVDLHKHTTSLVRDEISTDETP